MSSRGLYLSDDKSVLDIRTSSFYLQQQEVLSSILCKDIGAFCFVFKEYFTFLNALYRS